jgi:hypothetical protein
MYYEAGGHTRNVELVNNHTHLLLFRKSDLTPLTPKNTKFTIHSYTQKFWTKTTAFRDEHHEKHKG